MFLSKIWFFLVSVVAGVAITVALLMPRPAERESIAQEEKRLRRACDVTNILLRDNARARIQLASEFAQAIRQLKLSDTLAEAGKDEIISGETHATARRELIKLVESVQGTKPSFILLLDRQGRVVARTDNDETYGDSVAGYFLVEDALDGYVRDDLWLIDGTLYRVAGSPVITRQLNWAGAIILGQAIDKDFAKALAANLSAHINFYVGEEAVASSEPVQIHGAVVQASSALKDLDEGLDCAESATVEAEAGGVSYKAVSARLPGEAGQQGAFYSIFVQQEEARGFMATLKAVKKNDLSFSRFPWIPVAVLFIVIVGLGFVLMIREVDGPLKKLTKDSVALAQSEKDRLNEEMHRGRYGSIARSVNIAIDKLHRDAKSAKKDLDQLLGPAPSEGVSPSALPSIGPGGSGGSATPPPPSEFKFGGAGVGTPRSSGLDDLGLGGDDLGIGAPPPSPFGALPTPPPGRTPPPPIERTPPPIPTARPTNSLVPPKPVAIPGQNGIDDDILGGEDDAPEPTQLFEGARPELDEETNPVSLGDDGPYFREVFEKFISLKQECGEKIDNLTFERFSQKLRNNSDALIAKHGCKSVKFQVYVKDGKAALKASPVR